MPLLYKQILSDRENAYVINAFTNDSECCLALKKFVDTLKNCEINGENIDLFSALQNILLTINKDSNIYINSKDFEKISSKTTGSWDTINNAMLSFATNKFTTKKEQEKYCKQEVFSLTEISSWNIEKSINVDTLIPIDITSFWSGEYAKKLFDTEKNKRLDFESVIAKDHKNLKEDKNSINIIKEYLDTVQEIFNMVRPLINSSEYGGDLYLLGIFTTFSQKLEPIVQLYNQVRNYVTKKHTDIAKIKLMFGKPTLANGWDNNKIKDNLSVILRKDNLYYLGIIDSSSKIDLDSLACDSNESTYQKMVYKLLPGPPKMLPKVFFSQSKQDLYSPNKDLLNSYKKKEHLKGEKFNIVFCHELIDFFKESINKHEDWAKFNFRFQNTSSYNGIDEFYREVSDQGYYLKFINIPNSSIDQLVNDGKLYLFKIWNKDFATKATGIPNKSTIYWRQLFDSTNLKDVIFKLNGEAELFMRPQAIKKEVTHAVGEKLINKTILTDYNEVNDDAKRNPIPNKIYFEISNYVNNKISKNDLSKETLKHLEDYPLFNYSKGMPVINAKNKTIVKEVPFELIKDKRFTEEKYLFHVPITINFKAPSKPTKFNEKVLRYLENNPNINIIGLDRGEKNLIYLTLINQAGEILEQKSLNILHNINYHEKLNQREKERNLARKSWQEIGQIKDLKSGYLSGVIHEIAQMMVKNNAIVVMENLNIGFKRGRMKIEKQIYQKFEKALIDKLNYFIFKNETNLETSGSVLKGYQLTEKLDSFARLGSQCGFIFYVPADYTSKIDPTTGFINIFDTKECKTAESIKKFFNDFDSITYSASKDSFAFKFDYRKVKTYQNKKDYQNIWTVFSTKEAWAQEKDKKTGIFSPVFHNPTLEIKTAIEDLGLTVKDNFDLLSLIRSLEAQNSTAKFFKSLIYAFKLSVALRHSHDNEDKIISPVENLQGECFISQICENNLMPQDADANGAFHIALKGLYLLQNCIKDGKLGKISFENWIKFAQCRNK